MEYIRSGHYDIVRDDYGRQMVIPSEKEWTEVKRGRWIKWHWYADDSKDSLTEEYKCSECDFPWGETDYNFCPNCGAKMESEE